MALDLVPHPDHPPHAIRGVRLRWHFPRGGRFLLRFLVDGVDSLDVPAFAGRSRADGLWQATCFEMFLRDAQEGCYSEFNFSPSGQWAAYRFTDYREGRSDLDLLEPPGIETASGQFLYTLTATMDAQVLNGATALGTSAILVEKDGTRSFWAARHPQGRPDFHHAACFALPVPAPKTA